MASVDLHVTLCFLGAVDESLIAGLCERAAALQAADFELEFDALEYWPQSRVLAATSSSVSPAASELARALSSCARGLGLHPDEQLLRPHVTLVRGVASPQGPRGDALGADAPSAAALPLSPPLRLLARRFYLAQSHELEAATATVAQTARYTTLASWPLLMLRR